MNLSFPRKVWGRPVLVLGVAVLFATIPVMRRVPPLTTHALSVPINSTATVMPIPLSGLTALPILLYRKEARRRWAIVGGSLLQIGLSGPGAVALARAVAADPGSLLLRSALGEALVLANGGNVTREAKSHFDAVLAIDPNDLVARFYLAHWLLQNGKPKLALVKWVGLMRTVGNDALWYDRLWDVMPIAAEGAGVSRLALQALCVGGM